MGTKNRFLRFEKFPIPPEPGEPLRRVYALLDQVETLGDGNITLLFDSVDANWFDENGRPEFGQNRPTAFLLLSHTPTANHSLALGLGSLVVGKPRYTIITSLWMSPARSRLDTCMELLLPAYWAVGATFSYGLRELEAAEWVKSPLISVPAPDVITPVWH